jgi:hypothetical protein
MKSYLPIALVVVCLISAGTFILRKATDKENRQTITISGGVNKIMQGEQRKWFIPFAEIYGQADTKNENKGVFRCGLRLEF